MNQTILFLSKDIFFWPVVQSAAQAIGCTVVIINKTDDPKLTQLDYSQVGCCLIDLNCLEADKIIATVEQLREKLSTTRIVAFGPHVHESRLAAATQAGCSPVLSRGQLTARLSDYLAGWMKV